MTTMTDVKNPEVVSMMVFEEFLRVLAPVAVEAF
jgi:hypothetical protein